jgi:hypothetical protein
MRNESCRPDAKVVVVRADPEVDAFGPVVLVEPPGPRVLVEPAGPVVLVEPPGPRVLVEPAGPVVLVEPAGPRVLVEPAGPVVVVDGSALVVDVVETDSRLVRKKVGAINRVVPETTAPARTITTR